MRMLVPLVAFILCLGSAAQGLELSLTANREHCLEHQVYDPEDRSTLELKYYPDLTFSPEAIAPTVQRQQSGVLNNLGGTGAQRSPNADAKLTIHVFPPKIGATAAVYHIPETKAGKSFHITMEPYKSAAGDERRKRPDLSAQPENGVSINDIEKLIQPGASLSDIMNGVGAGVAVDRQFTGVYKVCFYAPGSFFGNLLGSIGVSGSDAVTVGSVWFQVRSSTHETYDSISNQLLHPHEDDPDDSGAVNERGGKIGLDELRGAKEAHVNMKGEGASTYHLQTQKKYPTGKQALEGLNLDLHLARLGLQEIMQKAVAMAAQLQAAQATSNSTFTRVWVFSVLNMLAMAVGGFLMSKQVRNELKRRATVLPTRQS